MLKKLVKKFASQELIDEARLRLDRFLKYKVCGYSQFGEDIFLRHYFSEVKSGFYVDVGAFHPAQHSNTCFLHRFSGWSGINIDANPYSVKLLKQKRPKDTNIQAVVSDEYNPVKYYSWGINSENSMNDLQINALKQKFGEPILITEFIPVSLANILDKHGPKNKSIDFLSIDVEGNDLSVLKSNDWKRYKPKIVAVEVYADYIEEVIQTEVYAYLSLKGYKMVSWYKPTLFFEFNG